MIIAQGFLPCPSIRLVQAAHPSVRIFEWVILLALASLQVLSFLLLLDGRRFSGENLRLLHEPNGVSPNPPPSVHSGVNARLTLPLQVLRIAQVKRVLLAHPKN